MQKIMGALSLLLFTWIAGCSLSATRGSGTLATETRNVSGFNTVELEGSGKLILEQNGTESLTITTDDNLLEYLTTEVHDGKLILRPKSNVNISPTADIVYHVTANNLIAITLGGSGTVTASGIKTDVLKTTLGGEGDFTLSGQADEQEITIAGSGKFQAADVKSRSVKISIAGSGDAVVAASDKLEVQIVGSGSIEYVGDPVVTNKVMVGSGSVRKR